MDNLNDDEKARILRILDWWTENGDPAGMFIVRSDLYGDCNRAGAYVDVPVRILVPAEVYDNA